MVSAVICISFNYVVSFSLLTKFRINISCVPDVPSTYLCIHNTKKTIYNDDIIIFIICNIYASGGFDNETPSRGGSSDGTKPRRNYDEQTLIPVTIKMIHQALADPSGGSDNLTLKDGRPLHMVKFIAAVRSCEERSTNFFIDVEDGTGMTSVKVWVNEGDECSATSKFRQEAGMEHQYIRVIGQIRDFDGTRQIVANDVRRVTSGNEITYHYLEVANSYERGLKMRSDAAMGMATGMMGGGIGIGNMASSSMPQGGSNGMGVQGQGYGGGLGGGSALNDAVLQVIKTMGGEFYTYINILSLSLILTCSFYSLPSFHHPHPFSLATKRY